MKKTKWIHARITEDQHKNLKVRLALNGLTIQQFIEKFIEDFLDLQNKEKDKEKKL